MGKSSSSSSSSSSSRTSPSRMLCLSLGISLLALVPTSTIAFSSSSSSSTSSLRSMTTTLAMFSGRSRVVEADFTTGLTAATTTTLTSSSSPSSMIGNWYNSYRTSLDTNPLATKMWTGAAVAILGDVIAQASSEISKRRKEEQQLDDEPLAMLTSVSSKSFSIHHKFQWLDYKRTVSFAAFYSVFRAIQHVLYPPMFQLCRGQYLSKVVGLVTRSTTTMSSNTIASCAAMEQALVSQLVIIPLIYYPLFFSVTSAMQGLTFHETIQRVKSTFISIMKRNLAFWIPCQFGTFLWVEEALQIPVLTVLGLMWTIILSLLAGAAKKPTTTVATTPATTTATATATTKPIMAATTTAATSTRGGGGEGKELTTATVAAQQLLSLASMEDTTTTTKNQNTNTNHGKKTLSLLFWNPKRQYSTVSLRSRK